MTETVLFDIDWDVIVFSETQREAKRECCCNSDGHVFCSSGGVLCSRGGACTINRKWVLSIQRIVAIYERICSPDIVCSSLRFPLVLHEFL